MLALRIYAQSVKLSFFSLFVLRRHHAVQVLEILGEIARIIEANHIGHLCHAQLTLAEQLLCAAQTNQADKLRRRTACQL